MPNAPKLTWLHVSDLHFGHGDAHYRFDQQGVMGAILRDAEARAKLLGPPDLIFVTGDIAFSGQREQYAQAKDWLTKLLAKVGGSPRLFVVPGNHDVNRKQAAKLAAAALHRELRANPKTLDDLLQDASQMQALWPKLGAYAEFAKDLGTPALTAETPFYSQEVDCQLGGKVVVVGLNTALLCLDDQDGPKTLGLGRGQILKAIEQQPTDALLLVLQHHPPEWLSDGKDLAAYLQLRPQIQFSGHVHQQQGVVHMPLLGGTRLQFVAGAGHMDQKEDGSHAYAWGQLSEEGLAYYSLVWLPERKCFAPATMLDSDDFKRGDHAFVERARLPKKLGNWLSLPSPTLKQGSHLRKVPTGSPTPPSLPRSTHLRPSPPPSATKTETKQAVWNALLLLDRIKQWNSLVTSISDPNKESQLVLLSGSWDQKISLFIQRIEEHLREHIPTSEVIKVPLQLSSDPATSAARWGIHLTDVLSAKLGVKGQEIPLAKLLAQATQKGPLVVVLVALLNPLQPLSTLTSEQQGALGAFLSELLPKRLADIRRITVLLSLEYHWESPSLLPWARECAKSKWNAHPLSHCELDKLTLPTWEEVEKYLRCYPKRLPLDTLLPQVKTLYHKWLSQPGITFDRLATEINNIILRHG